jgi:hypothetical protein
MASILLIHNNVNSYRASHTALQNTLKHNTTNVTQRLKRFQLNSARKKPVVSLYQTPLNPPLLCIISPSNTISREYKPPLARKQAQPSRTHRKLTAGMSLFPTQLTPHTYGDLSMGDGSEVVAFDDRCHFPFCKKRKVCFS